MAKSTTHRTHYTVVLNPKVGYSACGHGHPGRRWRGTKNFYSLPHALQWVDKVRKTLYKRKRPWHSFQILRYKNWKMDTLLFAYFDYETIVIPSLIRSLGAAQTTSI